MKRLRLRNYLLNTKSGIDGKAYNKQRNLCLSLIRQKNKTFLIILVQVTSQIIKHCGRQENFDLQIIYKQSLK